MERFVTCVHSPPGAATSCGALQPPGNLFLLRWVISLMDDLSRRVPCCAARVLFCSLVLSVAFSATSQAAKIAPGKSVEDLRRSPTNGKAPVDVAVGLY